MNEDDKEYTRNLFAAAALAARLNSVGVVYNMSSSGDVSYPSYELDLQTLDILVDQSFVIADKMIERSKKIE